MAIMALKRGGKKYKGGSQWHGKKCGKKAGGSVRVPLTPEQIAVIAARQEKREDAMEARWDEKLVKKFCKASRQFVRVLTVLESKAGHDTIIAAADGLRDSVLSYTEIMEQSTD